MSSGSAYLLVTMYLQQVLHYSPLKAGLIVAPAGILNVVFGLFLGRLITRMELRASITAATVLSGLLIPPVASQVSATSHVLPFETAGKTNMATRVDRPRVAWVVRGRVRRRPATSAARARPPVQDRPFG